MTILTPLRALSLLAVMWLLPISDIAQARGPAGGERRAGGGFSRGVLGGGPIASPAGVARSVSDPRFTPSAGSQAAGDARGFLSDAQPPARDGHHASKAQAAIGGFQSGPEPFSPAWYAQHPAAWQHTHPHADAAAVASAAAVAGWLAYAAYPAAIVDPTTVVYESGEPIADEPASPSDAPRPDLDAGAPEWLELGVYELKPADSRDSPRLVRLSVDRGGVVKGVFVDQLTGATQNVSGWVDRATGTVAWALDGNPATTFRTTLDDLIRPEGAATLSLRSGEQPWALQRTGGA